MASFESKVSDLFDENPRLARKIPIVIRKLFHESESEFKRRMKNESEKEVEKSFLQLFDVLFIDFYFSEIDDRFLDWVIDHYPERFTQTELEEMRAQAASYLDFYEVQDVIPGKGSHIKSLCTENKGFLKDVSSSYNLVKWDIFLARCYDFRGDYYATGSLTLFKQTEKEYILDQLAAARSDFSDQFGESEFSRFSKNRWDVLYQICREIHEKAKNKKFYTTYGELQPCEVRFQVRDVNSVLKRIDQFPEFHFTGSKELKRKKRKLLRYEYDWFTRGIEEELEPIKSTPGENEIILFTHQLDTQGNKTGIEVIGTLYVDKYLARLETRSVELAEFAGPRFPQLCDAALKFKRIIKIKNKSKDRDMNQEREAKTTSTQMDSEMLNKIEDQFYLNQLDEKIPALNNMTPREASHDETMLPLLIEWLKGLENGLERRRKNGESTFSIIKLKKELDIDW